jgi:hypothetical protein
MKIVFTFLLAIFINHALAETSIQINGASIHDKPGYNQFNYGGGVEQTISDRWSVAGGWYRNSEYRGSAYGYARYSVYQDGPWNLGIGVGAVTGYKKAIVLPMAFPEVCYSYLCAIALPRVEPGGASVLGVHLKLPVN